MTTVRVIGNSLCPYSADFAMSAQVVCVVTNGLLNVRNYVNQIKSFYIYDPSQICYPFYYNDFQFCITWTVGIHVLKLALIVHKQLENLIISSYGGNSQL